MRVADLEGSLTLLEASHLSRLHPATIRKAVRLGELPHFRVFRKILIRRADFERWLSATFSPMTRGEAER